MTTSPISIVMTTMLPRGWRRRLVRLSLIIPLAFVAMMPRAMAASDGLTDLILPESQERQLAEQEHPKIVAAFGGEYRDPQLANYVNSLAAYLGKVSDRPDLQYRVTILNSPVVNAFALPAGYVYVTRGLLALANNEAELAGVIGHEIGHITARHVAQRYSRTVLAQGLIGLLGAVTKGTAYQGITDLAQPLAAVALQSYSREQENEADGYGIKYMSRAGYDPYGMASFLASLQAEVRFEGSLVGDTNPDRFDLLATHPRTADRVVATIQEAKLTHVVEPMVEHKLYLEKIDGILYGDDPEQGYIRGRVFAHPKLGLRFEVPEGFTLLNSESQVVAQAQGSALIRFDQAKLDRDMTPERYLRDIWFQGRSVSNFETLDINGFQSVTGTTRLQQESGPLDLRYVAIKTAPGTIYRLLFVTSPDLTQRYGDAFKGTTYSFRPLTDAERRSLKPYRIKTVTVRPGETVETLARQLAFPDHQVERFRVLNGLKPGEDVVAGNLVKLVVER